MTLEEYLGSIPHGRIEDTAHLETLLAARWDEFAGANQHGMDSSKLRARMEHVEWNGELLSFVIERHGGTVHGSTRAERQRWTIDVTRRTASCRTAGYRQDRPRQAGVNVKPTAEEIANLIINHQNDERLKWNVDGSVRVLIGEIPLLDSEFAQTREGRRKRFRIELEKILGSAGWRTIRANVYAPPSLTSTT